VTVVKSAKSVEELFLGTLLSGKKLDIINHQDIGLTVALAESHQGIVLNRIDELIGELFASEVNDACILFHRKDVVADRLKQMGFPKAAAAVDEKRVVGSGRGIRHRLRSCMGELIVSPNDETIKSVGRVHSRCCRSDHRVTSDSGGL
jgi:hypothetical protein